MNCGNCVDNKGEPMISYAGTCLTDYRSNNEIQNDLKKLLSQNGCNSNNSYEFARCMQNNSGLVLQYLNQNFNNALSTSKCNNNGNNSNN